eukprot:3626499-Rhodomonas_salina.2
MHVRARCARHRARVVTRWSTHTTHNPQHTQQNTHNIHILASDITPRVPTCSTLLAFLQFETRPLLQSETAPRCHRPSVNGERWSGDERVAPPPEITRPLPTKSRGRFRSGAKGGMEGI